MKKEFIILTILFVISFFGCKEEEYKAVVETQEVVFKTCTSITCVGSILNVGTGTIKKAGFCWSTDPSPTLENNSVNAATQGAFTCLLEGLTPGTLYYIRAFAVNSVGVSYGNELQETTLPPLETGSVEDAEGNTYSTVKIGNQWWMAENLRASKYRNGEVIPNVEDGFSWQQNQEGMLCYYNNDSANFASFGALYNYHVVSDSRSVCPVGWHVPTSNEWQILISFLGGGNEASYKMIDPENSNWISLTGYYSNESGFSAQASGSRDMQPVYSGFYQLAVWWTSDVPDQISVNRVILDPGLIGVDDSYPNHGYSIRCIND